jgi:dihydropteroate synthase
MSLYLRPLGLVFGADARGLIASGQAGALGGLPHIAFTHVEEITRIGGTILRDVKRFENCQHADQLDAITRSRADFGGIELSTCRIMGIVNVTPDSFSDGGKLANAEAGIAHGLSLAAQGADILDVGGESTRPGSDTVAIDEEIARVVPVISGLSQNHVVSCDTRKSAVMVQALLAGAKIINDVSALGFDERSAGVVGFAGVPVVLMHAQGEPKTMQLNPRYDDVVLDVYDGLAAKIAAAEAAGIERARICIDPGIGFGKSFKQNLQLLSHATIFHGLGVALLIGLPRKGFVGALTGEGTAANRAYGSVGGALQAAMQGAHILRVHDVKATRQALSVWACANDPDSADV